VVTTQITEVRFEGGGPVRAEIQQARDDLDRDLDTLLSSSQLKDVRSELRGWATAIRSAASDALTSARFALDPRQRDRALAGRHTLGDYARLARYVGALTPTLSDWYRKLAQSCDLLAGLTLVVAGDALAEGGVTRGAGLLQAPASELRARRDAAINALRILIGSTEHAYGPNEWPRGIEAYRQFLRRSGDAGQSDLRALFDESNLARLFDELIDLASSSSADSLRALGATATVAIQRLRRLALFGNRLVVPSSPTLTAFLSAVMLFVQAFERTRSGVRLLFVARPPIITYGLYGIGGPDPASDRLSLLATYRNQLSELLDCYLGCECGPAQVACLVQLDKILYDVDRAIDLYAMGIDPNGTDEPGYRAMAYGALIDTFIEQSGEACALPERVIEIDEDELGRLRELTRQLEREMANADPGAERLGELLRDINEAVGLARPVDLGNLHDLLVLIRDVLGWPARLPEDAGLREDAATAMHHELCVQEDGERRWEELVQAMAPACVQDEVFLVDGRSVVRNLIAATQQAIADATDTELGDCATVDFTIPPHHETSLDSIAEDIDRVGTGRPLP
jgi:hypothetical protein